MAPIAESPPSLMRAKASARRPALFRLRLGGCGKTSIRPLPVNSPFGTASVPSGTRLLERRRLTMELVTARRVSPGCTQFGMFEVKL